MTAPGSTVGNSAASRDKAFVLHPYTNLHAHETQGPLIIERGEGVHVFDDGGKDYIEGMASLWCVSLGWGEERLVQAAAKQMRQLSSYHIFGHKSHEPGIDLVGKADRAGAGADVQGVLRQFRVGSQRHRDQADLVLQQRAWPAGEEEDPLAPTRLSRRDGGDQPSLTGLPNNHRDFDLPIARIIHGDCPHHYRNAHEGESEEAFATRLAEQLEALILAEGPDTIAAMFAEPVMGAGGVVVPPRDLLRQDPAGVEEIRHPAGRRRGDLRFRPHRQFPGAARPWACSRTS